MRLKLFRGASTVEAMAQVRRELGPDALILSQRRVADGVEVTAAIEDARPAPASAPPQLAPDAATLRGLAFHGASPEIAASLAAGPLVQRLSGQFTFKSLALQQGSQPVLFAGPPGAGKTLTVARLATRLVMAGQKPMVITADGKRAGAAEQLAAFTRLLSLDLVVASNPVPMARALARRQEGAPVLIDMPGGSPFDTASNQELAALASVAQARIAVVLPAGSDCTEAREMASAFATMGAEYLVATRLDVARRLGCVLAAGISGLALTEAGIGPGAADGLVPLTADLLARRLLDVPPQWERNQ